MSKLIPEFNKVKEVVNHRDSMVIIALDPNSGRKGRYSVIRLIREPGNVEVIGCELPLKTARQIAHRPTIMDGLPLPQKS